MNRLGLETDGNGLMSGELMLMLTEIVDCEKDEEELREQDEEDL